MIYLFFLGFLSIFFCADSYSAKNYKIITFKECETNALENYEELWKIFYNSFNNAKDNQLLVNSAFVQGKDMYTYIYLKDGYAKLLSMNTKKNCEITYTSPSNTMVLIIEKISSYLKSKSVDIKDVDE